eukprot:8978290-Pyramimonas_sp.AAC.1
MYGTPLWHTFRVLRGRRVVRRGIRVFRIFVVRGDSLHRCTAKPMTVRVSLLGAHGQVPGVRCYGGSLWRHASPSTLYTQPPQLQMQGARETKRTTNRTPPWGWIVRQG